MPRRTPLLPPEITALRHAADRGGKLTVAAADLKQSHYRYLLHSGLIRPCSVELDRPCPSWRLGKDDQRLELPSHVLTDEGWQESGRHDMRSDGFLRIVFRLADARRPWREFILEPGIAETRLSMNGYRLGRGSYSPPKSSTYPGFPDGLRAMIGMLVVDRAEFDHDGATDRTAILHWHGRRVEVPSSTPALVAISLMSESLKADLSDLKLLLAEYAQIGERPSIPARLSPSLGM